MTPVTNVSPNSATTSGDDASGVVACDTLFSSMSALSFLLEPAIGSQVPARLEGVREPLSAVPEPAVTSSCERVLREACHRIPQSVRAEQQRASLVSGHRWFEDLLNPGPPQHTRQRERAAINGFVGPDRHDHPPVS